MWVESGGKKLSFVDVTDTAGVAGPVPEGSTEPIPVASANAVAADYDRDGDTDVFVNVNIVEGLSLVELRGRNILWRNNGDGTFTDVTDEVGLGVTRLQTRHSSFLDIDNDGDMDLYENNNEGANYLWRNRLVETGIADFEDVTAEFSPEGENLAYPWESFVTAPADFNNDGWEDLLVVKQGGEEPNSPYPNGHALFINQRGIGFENVAVSGEAGLNSGYLSDGGTMGCEVGDVNADGVPDVYLGNGMPDTGQVDQLLLSIPKRPGVQPAYSDMTALVNFPAPTKSGITYPAYPYRTHGTVFVDVNNDGILEIAIANGGSAAWPEEVREPDRLFQFNWVDPPEYFKVRPVGNGTTVSKDAIGTRFALTVSKEGEAPWTLHRTLFGGSCFSAQNGFEVHFGLQGVDTIQELRITWPDGVVETITEGLSINSSMVVQR